MTETLNHMLKCNFLHNVMVITTSGQEELPKDSNKQNFFMLSIVCSNADHKTD